MRRLIVEWHKDDREDEKNKLVKRRKRIKRDSKKQGRKAGRGWANTGERVNVGG